LSLSLSPLTTGLARAMASRPAARKSKAHACRSGYRCTPQKVAPQRHANPVRPTRFRQLAHLPACLAPAGAIAGATGSEEATAAMTASSGS
jgi:hypothetical protein